MKYDSSITYHSKAMANVNVFADKQMDRWTKLMDRRKTISPDLSMQGLKKIIFSAFSLYSKNAISKCPKFIHLVKIWIYYRKRISVFSKTIWRRLLPQFFLELMLAANFLI